MRRLLLAVLFLPGLALGQNAVKLYTTDTVQSACNMAGSNNACTVAMAGKSTAAFIVTAAASPVLTLTPEVSMDGTTYVATYFDDPATMTKVATLADSAAGTTRTIYMAGGARYVRVRTSAFTSGTMTAAVVATDTHDNGVPFSGATTSTTQPPAVAQVGGWVTTAAPSYSTTTLNPLSLDAAGNLRVAQPVTGNPCLNPNATLAWVAGSTSGTSAVQIIALSGSNRIYICSLNVTGVSGTTPAFGLVYGTGTNCGTGQTTVQGAFTTTAAALYSFHGPGPITAAGTALCYLNTGTTPVQRYSITYVQAP
jgi:hypothetical protein